MADRRSWEKGIEDVQQGICDLIKLGVTPVKAAMSKGISEPTFEDWMHKGRMGGKGHALHIKFRQAVLQAEAECEVILITQIRKGQNWQAATWLAERRFPERFVRRSVNGDQDNRPDGRPASGGNPFEQLDSVVPLNRDSRSGDVAPASRRLR